ncbi:mismatch-specific DNA-glycosylase [Kaistia algarum]|uniref:mismatch-specific DNA-glycosylase n=1 Tax=Kaistia algarum TaxID=2083279 RepID=UPI000CE80985|nr:mismatch-specific DNA-glycosylase [Kaistia algarum]MCX5515106.1 mismatch-specific DNA-glycosylase [Kaistia algarum]PPE79834.1 mismatch-specific DNA-glycosylase [Kaistia algarum]
MPILPDILAPDLDVVFCGTGAGAWSARVGAYYGKPGNKFWPTLHEVGLTPRRLQPAEFREVLGFGIGLTDVAKEHVGQDDAIDLSRVDAAALHEKIGIYRPLLLAFTSKRAASLALGRPTGTIPYGEQVERIGASRLHVLTSPSGAAGSYWSLDPWLGLAAAVRAGRTIEAARRLQSVDLERVNV